jgi:hypothetical protein
MKNNIKRIVLIILIIINCGVIFSFSAQQAEESSGVSSRVVEAIIKNTYKNKQISEDKMFNIREKLTTIVRKSAHFLIYTCLGILVYLFTGTYQISFKDRFWYTFAFCMLYACSDEIHQRFVEGRSGEIRDVCIDTSGAVCGTLIVAGISKIVNLIKKK